MASRAACPTIAIRPNAAEYRTTGPIVVGLNGPQSDAAFRFAVEEAQRRGTTVDAVHTVWLPVVAMPIEGTNITGTSETYVRRTAEEHVDEEASPLGKEPWPGRHRDLELGTTVVYVSEQIPQPESDRVI